jgi:hypothetical protein
MAVKNADESSVSQVFGQAPFSAFFTLETMRPLQTLRNGA